jgi:multiple sugar transport system permease protein
MAIAEAQVFTPQAPRPKYRPLEDERWLAFFLMAPALLLLALFIAYPFIEGIWLAVTNSRVGVRGQFVGFANFVKIWNDSIFRTSVYNTVLYTVVTTIFKLGLGLWLAVLLNRHFRGKAMVRAFILLPFIIPTVLSTFAWKWMFDPTFSVLNWLLFKIGLITGRINWLGDPDLAMLSIIIVNIWRGVPFFAISLLAGLQTISPELHEAAAIDGANFWQRFRHITLPMLSPVIFYSVIVGIIGSFQVFNAAFVMTQGGPGNATLFYVLYLYRKAWESLAMGYASALAWVLFVIVLILTLVQFRLASRWVYYEGGLRS